LNSAFFSREDKQAAPTADVRNSFPPALMLFQAFVTGERLRPPPGDAAAIGAAVGLMVLHHPPPTPDPLPGVDVGAIVGAGVDVPEGLTSNIVP